MTYQDLRDWIDKVEELGELRRISGAHVDDDVAPITDVAEHAMDGPAVLFDRIQGFEPDHRILVNPISSLNRVALMVGFPTGLSKADYCDLWRTRLQDLPDVPPKVVTDGPLLENVFADDQVDLLRFPVPRWHDKDGGRYIGTGDAVICRDPDGGWVNIGTYRVMVVDERRVCVYTAPGKHATIFRDKLFAEGKPMRVAISVGQDPLILLAGGTQVPYGKSEYGYIGGLKGEPVEVLEGDYTGLPIPARAEIVLEGEISPAEKHREAPFGEWPGYYASGERMEYVTTIHRVYHRNSPIMTGTPPAKPPTGKHTALGTIRAARIREEIRKAGIPEVQHVWLHECGSRFLVAVSIKQRYPGHATQVGHVAAMCQGGAYMGRIVIVVDEDIDAYNLNDVMWAVCTRSDPATDVSIIKRAWSDELDPMVPPGQKKNPFTSRMIIDATRPWEWREQFSDVVELTPEVREATLRKWGPTLFGSTGAPAFG
ncbi:UbiD family decarboxylase [Actinophytocola sp.]|uniref:UbiD family decarboxylase n=1 Tax=Actinophytocola sp. TaxID=1872138 RepID=UPI003D6C451B